MKTALTRTLIAALALTALGGCTRVRYMDSESPAGSVAPLGETAAPVTRADDPAFKSQKAKENEVPVPSSYDRKGRRLASNSAEVLGTEESFAAAYAKQGSPRIAVFVNRILTPEVREWAETPDFLVSDTESSEWSSSSIRTRNENERTDASKSQSKDSRDISVYLNPNVADGSRRDPIETVSFAMENGFMMPLLRGGANLVDRATILRLQAVNEGLPVEGSRTPVKTLEVNALREKADIFVELLITRSPASPTGYEFAAIAKEVETGRIVGSTTTANWEEEDYPVDRTKLQTDPELKVKKLPPRVGDIAALLSYDLMKSLTQTWSR